jgi:predicted DCC family thiol-disulfide oxidoreductase YuxK
LDIAKELGGIFSFAIVFKILPTPFLNFIYDYVAKNRYKWYGQQEHCLLPTPELKAKFL